MGKWKAVLPIVLALLIALSGSVFPYRWLQAQTKPKEVVKVESEAVPIAVTTMDLSWGTKLKKEIVRTTPFLKESLPPGYFSDPSSLEGRVLITTMKQNEPITESKLAPEDVSTGGVSPILKPGKRAIALRNVTDSATALTRGATIPETLASLPKPAPSQAPADKKKKGETKEARIPPGVFTVEKIKGDNASKRIVTNPQGGITFTIPFRKAGEKSKALVILAVILSAYKTTDIGR